MTAPRFIQPCSPTTASKPPTGERWTHKVKWDGFRFQIAKIGKEIRLFSRNGVDWTERMPAIAAAFAHLPARVAQIDGELCLCDVDGRPDFRALMRAARQRPADETRLSFHAFDLLQLNAADLKPKPLAERRRRLVDLVRRLDEAVPGARKTRTVPHRTQHHRSEDADLRVLHLKCAEQCAQCTAQEGPMKSFRKGALGFALLAQGALIATASWPPSLSLGR